MSPIQQAILLVKATPRQWEASIQAETEGIHAVDRQEMLDWFTRVSSSVMPPCETESVFFHPLPSGRFALAKILPRRETEWTIFQAGASFYVHLLVLSRETLLQFANNPLRIYRIVGKRKLWLRLNQEPGELRPIKLTRGGPMLDRRFLAHIMDRYGAESLARLLQSTFDSVCTLFSSENRPLQVIEAILTLLPVRWRTELSFSTELHFSLHCPVKLIGQPSRAVHASPLSRVVPAFALQSRPRQSHPRQHVSGPSAFPTEPSASSALILDPWPLFICHILQRRDFALLERCLTGDLLDNPPLEPFTVEPDSEKLDDFGNDCLDRLFATLSDGQAVPRAPEKTNENTESSKRGISGPFRPKRLERELSAIDSFTARALFGDGTALELLRNRWKQVAVLLSRNERDDLRIEYVRLVHSVLTRPAPREPKEYRRGLDALDVLAVFLEEYRG